MLSPLYLSEGDRVMVGGVLVLGYDLVYESPIITAGTSEITLDRAMRMGWDNGEDRFTEDEVKKIKKAVEHLVNK